MLFEPSQTDITVARRSSLHRINRGDRSTSTPAGHRLAWGLGDFQGLVPWCSVMEPRSIKGGATGRMTANHREDRLFPSDRLGRQSKPGTERTGERTRSGKADRTRPVPIETNAWLKEDAEMRILVVYASRYGATRGIAERIGRKLNEGGQEAEVVSVSETKALESYDAFVVGSAIYAGSLMKEATDFVRNNAVLLGTRPVWLFASGPVGTKANAPSADVQKLAIPKEFAPLKETIHPRDEHVFFGAFDHTKLKFKDRLVYGLPAVKKILPDGDFRDWGEIDGWATSIASALVPATVS